MELSLSGTKVPGIFRSRERKFHGTFVPGSESSIEFSVPGAKVPPMELSLPGAKVLGNESSCYLKKPARKSWCMASVRAGFKVRVRNGDRDGDMGANIASCLYLRLRVTIASGFLHV